MDDETTPSGSQPTSADAAALDVATPRLGLEASSLRRLTRLQKRNITAGVKFPSVWHNVLDPNRSLATTLDTGRDKGGQSA